LNRNAACRNDGTASGERSHNLLSSSPSPRHRRFLEPTHASGHRRRARRMDGSQLSPTHVHVWATPAPTDKPVADEEEYYSSWSLFLVCVLLILSLWTSYYLQIKRIRVIHETLVSIFAGMFVGLIVRLAPGNMIREMLVRELSLTLFGSTHLPLLDI
jgi:hypothetical protein